MKQFKILKANHLGERFHIEEDLPGKGWNTFHFHKNGTSGKCMKFENLDDARKYLKIEYGIDDNSWFESSEKLNFTVVYDNQSDEIDNLNEFRIINYSFKSSPIIIWGISLVISLILKVLHLPFGAVLTLLCSAGLTSWVITEMIFLQAKNKIINLISSISLIWCIILIWGSIFNNGYPFNFDGLKIYGVVLIVYFIVYYALKSTKVRNFDIDKK